MNDYSNYNFIHEAILYETVDKYEEQGKKHSFYKFIRKYLIFHFTHRLIYP